MLECHLLLKSDLLDLVRRKLRLGWDVVLSSSIVSSVATSTARTRARARLSSSRVVAKANINLLVATSAVVSHVWVLFGFVGPQIQVRIKHDKLFFEALLVHARVVL